MTRMFVWGMCFGLVTAAQAAAQSPDPAELLQGSWRFDAEKTAREIGKDEAAAQYAAVLGKLRLAFTLHPDGSLDAVVNPTAKRQELTGRWRVVERRSKGEFVIEWSYGGTPPARSLMRFLDRDTLLATSLSDPNRMVLSRTEEE